MLFFRLRNSMLEMHLLHTRRPFLNRVIFAIPSMNLLLMGSAGPDQRAFLELPFEEHALCSPLSFFFHLFELRVKLHQINNLLLNISLLCI